MEQLDDIAAPVHPDGDAEKLVFENDRAEVIDTESIADPGPEVSHALYASVGLDQGVPRSGPEAELDFP